MWEAGPVPATFIKSPGRGRSPTFDLHDIRLRRGNSNRCLDNCLPNLIMAQWPSGMSAKPNWRFPLFFRSLFILLFLATSVVLSPAQPSFSAGVIAGTVEPANQVIVEDSGLAASRRNPNVYWTHNDRMGLDTGTTPEIYAIDDTGRLLGTYTLPQPPAVLHDFEDIALGPGPVAGVSYLYVGDVGDTISSHAAPADNIIYRIPEPSVTASQIGATPLNRTLKGVEAIILHFPDGRNHNCETMMVDPLTGDLFVITKGNYSSPGQTTITDSLVFTTPAADLIAGATNALQLVGAITALPQAIPGDRTTGGDISVTGREIIVRTYRHAFLWEVDPGQGAGQGIGQALVNGTPIRVPLTIGPSTPDGGTAIPPTVTAGGAGAQGESIAFDAFGLNYVSHSENNGSARPLYRYDRTTPGPVVPQLLVAPGSVWSYLHDGTDPGPDWTMPPSDGWATGPAQLGYGDGDQATSISFGADPANKPLTAFFRHTFTVADPAAFGWLVGRLIYDDGAAVYINGIDVARFALPVGAAWNEPASSQQQNELEDTWFEFAIPVNVLQAGSNVVAVEVHQSSPSSSDLSFDFQLVAGPPVGDALITRITRPANTVRLFYQAPNGFVPSQLQRTFDLNPSDWQPAPSFTVGVQLGFPFVETPVTAGADREIYRLLFRAE